MEHCNNSLQCFFSGKVFNEVMDGGKEMKLVIRPEKQEDFQDIEQLILDAFEKEEVSDHQEHILVQKIRQTDAYVNALSLVALLNDELVGHLVLSKIFIQHAHHQTKAFALAPVAVKRGYENRGIGTTLIKKALIDAESYDEQVVIVLGHADYYPRFGFEAASKWGVKAPFEVPDDVFMLYPLHQQQLTDLEGLVVYSEAFQ